MTDTIPEAILAATATVQDDIVSEPALVDAPSPAVVDPSYREPTSVAAFEQVRDSISRDQDAENKCSERGALIDFLIERIKVLESALMPIATQSVVLSNARMCLIAAGEGDSPAGGTWFSNPPNGIQMQATEGLFFNACDALGREHVQLHLTNLFAKLQAAQRLQAEKQAAVAAGTPVH